MEIKDKAYNILKQNDDMYKKQASTKQEELNNNLEQPSFTKNNNNVDINKSKDILNQINSYLDNEKKNLQ